LKAVDPYRCVRSQLRISGNQLIIKDLAVSLPQFKRIMLLAIGKASVPMLRATLKTLRGSDVYGALIAPKGRVRLPPHERVEVFHAGHPVPDRQGWAAAQHVTSAVSRMQKDELLICLISGGASAMLADPAEGISLADIRILTNQLVKSGATIHNINTVRRHTSKLKGGRLVEFCGASKILSLIISDVPGNPLHDIASGLTAEDPTTFKDAIEILRAHNLWDTIPSSIRKHLSKGALGELPETPKQGNSSFENVHNMIMADNGTACIAAQQFLARKLPCRVLSSSLEMDTRSMGRFLAALANERKEHNERVRSSGAIVVGGETTVGVKGRGIGGRNQETALWAINYLPELEGVAIATFGTDGIDGNSPAAGALIDGNTKNRAILKKIDPDRFLESNDSYRFFRRLRDNILTGPTGTNVGDLNIIITLD